MARRIDTLKKAYLANKEALKEVPSDPKLDVERRKHLYKPDVVVDANIRYGISEKTGQLTGLITASKSHVAAIEKGEAYGGYNFNRRALSGVGIAGIMNSIEGGEATPEARAEREAQMKAAIEANDGKPITERVAFSTTTYKDKDGKATIQLSADAIKPATIDFKEEDKLKEVAKEYRLEQAKAAEEAKEAKTEKKAEAPAKKAPVVEEEDEIEL